MNKWYKLTNKQTNKITRTITKPHLRTWLETVRIQKGHVNRCKLSGNDLGLCMSHSDRAHGGLISHTVCLSLLGWRTPWWSVEASTMRRQKADTHYTIPQRVEGWVDLGPGTAIMVCSPCPRLHSGCRDKHNCPWWDLNLGSLTFHLPEGDRLWCIVS